MEYGFLIGVDELVLRYRTPSAPMRLSFDRAGPDFARWRKQAVGRLTRLLRVERPGACRVTPLRETVHSGARITALVMRANDDLSLPGYLLHPAGEAPAPEGRAVLALHGHGQVDQCLGIPGVHEDYHHHFPLKLAEAGHTVLLPELRGFGALYDLAHHLPGESLNYWQWGEHMTYTLLTDGLLHGRTLTGDTVEDLLRWEHWLASAHGVEAIDVAGISWGGDLAWTYPVFSERVRSIFASGTLGSFTAIYTRCGNAPAHCVPGVLDWFDRADIAGLNAPRRLALHYGALDVPGPGNGSAAYNDTVDDAFRRLRRIYAAAGAPDAVSMHVTEDMGHEMDNDALLRFLSEERE